MNNLKINIDRPKISSIDVKSKMDFEQVLKSHQVMSLPFYKTSWFFGTTGLATITLVATTIYGFENKTIADNDLSKQSSITSSVPPDIVQNQKPKEEIINKEINKINELPIEKKSTLIKQTTNQKPLNINTSDTDKSISDVETEAVTDVSMTSESEEVNKVFNYFDFHPRISGKINGNITKRELFDDKGLVTNTNVEVVHFELHLVDGVGGKVFEENGHLLTSEMKEAIENVIIGDEIYFEDIQGVTKKGEKVRLNPLRYTILN